MNDSKSQTAYGVFKPVGHVLASFPTERDARSAVEALKEAGFPEVAFYAADEVRRIAGLRSGEIEARLGYRLLDCVVHRDDLVVTS